MRGTIRKVLAKVRVVAIALLIATPHAVCSAANSSGIAAQIETMVANIQKEPDVATRVRSARDLSLFVRSQERTNLDNLSSNAVDAVASLLLDRPDAVKAWAAITLGDIGFAALRAEPALEAALKHSEPALEYSIIGKIGPSISAKAEILDALKKIHEKPK